MDEQRKYELVINVQICKFLNHNFELLTLNFLRLIRWPNLLIIAATMYMLRYFIMLPLLDSYGLNPQMKDLDFFLLILATVLLAAAGYIVNDLYDVNTDKINKPTKIIIGKLIGLRFAENLHLLLNLVAIIIGIYISYSIGIRSVSLAFLVVAGLLYFYSTTYKSQLIVGNLMVSFFAALVPLMVLLFELPLLKTKYRIFENSGFNLNFLVIWFVIYASFAFLISFAREIVKDIQDIKGDSANAIRTLPVVYGIKISKFIVLILLAAIVALIFYILIRFIHDPISLTYILPFILTPVIYTGWIVYKASGIKDYEKASLFCKITMLTGMLYSIIVKFVLLNVL